MPDVRIGQVDNALPRPLEVPGMLVDRRNPAERLMRRRDVVTVGRKDDERIEDVAKIDAAVLVNPNLSLLQLVADKEILDNRHDLSAAEPVKPTPPSFELEKALTFRVNICEQIGILVPNSILRLEVFEILSEPGAIEAPVAEIAKETRHPYTA